MKPELQPYRDSWQPDDPHANFKAEVANYSVADPLPTLENLSNATGIPLDSLIRYVLVKWAASGAEALLALEPIVIQQMREHVRRADEIGTDVARLESYEALRQMINWLSVGERDENE